MSIATALTALHSDVENARDKIAEMGGTVTPNGGTSQLAADIATIPQGSSITVEPLSVTENGTYTALDGFAYSPVTVNVQGGGAISKYSGSVTTTTDDLDIVVSVPKSEVSNPQLIVLFADVSDPLTELPSITVIKAIGAKAFGSNYSGSSVAVNAQNGSVVAVTNGTARYAVAECTFKDVNESTEIRVHNSGARFRTVVQYLFTVYGWEEPT